jgi:transposase-like protein
LEDSALGPQRRCARGCARSRSTPVKLTGVTSEEILEIRELRRKNHELEQSIEILKAATT